MSLLAGCGTLQTRDQVRGEKKQAGPGQPTEQLPVAGQPQAPSSPESSDESGDMPPDFQPEIPAAPPTFLNKELPKVGLILGAGGMKAYAHLGALRAITRARIPIHALVGMEWGAVVGGLYSMQGQVNEAEWQAFKLKKENLPEQGGFLSSGFEPKPISALREFFETAYSNVRVENSKITFACPTRTVRGDRFYWQTRGLMREAMTRCAPYPPLYKDNGGYLASPFSVAEAAAWLRERGANVIVLVNVLGEGEVFNTKMASQHYVENLLWGEIRGEMLKVKSPLVTHVINVNTSGHPVTDFDGRRGLMDAGSKAASPVVQSMVSKYGF